MPLSTGFFGAEIFMPKQTKNIFFFCLLHLIFHALYDIITVIKGFSEDTMGDLLNLVNNLRAGDMNFTEFIGGLGQWFNDIGVGGKVTSVTNASWFPFVALAVGALFIFYGKKWLGFIQFASCGGMGFVLGLVLNPMLVDTLSVLEGKAWITGSLCALILAVLNKLIFGLLFFGGPALLVFLICYFGAIIPFDIPTMGNLPVCIGIAAGTSLLMFLLRRDVARIVTAVLGGFIINFGVKKLYDYTASIPKYAMMVDLGVVALLAVMGFVYQYRRRRRYY